MDDYIIARYSSSLAEEIDRKDFTMKILYGGLFLGGRLCMVDFTWCQTLDKDFNGRLQR